MSENSRSIDRIADAEIVPDMGGPNQWLVRVGPEEYEMVPKSGRNTLILKDNYVSASLDDGFSTVSVNVGQYTVEIDFEQNKHRISQNDGEAFRVPSASVENVMWATYDRDEDRLARLYSDIVGGRARASKLDHFLPRFEAPRSDGVLEITEDGWVIDNEILVTYNVENYTIQPDNTYSHSDATAFDDERQARDISFDIPNEDTFDVNAGDSVTTTITRDELEFLTTVQYILESEYEYAIGNGFIGDIVEQAHINSFTDTKSGLHHGHSLEKHDLSDLNVSDEAIEKLWSNSYDHTGVWEMSMRRQEFENAPFDVFDDDAANDDGNKWRKIERTKENAPIPQSTKDMLREMYE